MSLTVAQIVDTIRERGLELDGPEVDAALPAALNAFGDKIAKDARPDIRNLLRKDFSVTITSGTGSLSTAFTASEPLIAENVKDGNLYVTSGTTPCQWLPDRTQLGLTRPAFFIYYTIDGTTLRTRNITDGSLTSLSTTMTVTGNYVPLLSSVPSQLEDELVEEVIKVITEMRQSAQQAEAA